MSSAGQPPAKKEASLHGHVTEKAEIVVSSDCA